VLCLFSGTNLFAQNESETGANPWNLTSFGVRETWGDEKYFKPLTFQYFQRNSPGTDPKYFTLPPGASENTYRDYFDTSPSGLGVELAWPVGLKYNEVRAGFAFQKHRNDVDASSKYLMGTDTYRLHHIRLQEEYEMAQLSFDLVLETAPVAQALFFFWSGGATLGTAVYQDLTHTEETTDIPASDFSIQPDGSVSYSLNNASHNIKNTSLGSQGHIEAGLRSSAGAELQLTILKQTLGFSGEYGFGIIGQQVLKGGSGSLKRTNFGLLRVRYFL